MTKEADRRLQLACGAVLSWAESTQRPPLSWKKALKELKTSSPIAHLRYLFPVAAQNSAWSFFLAYAAPRAPSLLELPALFCLRRSIKESIWRESGGNSYTPTQTKPCRWSSDRDFASVIVFFLQAFLFSLLLFSFLFSRKEKRKKRIVTPDSPASLWSS